MLLWLFVFAVLLLSPSTTSYSGAAPQNDSTATLSRTIATLNLSDPLADLDLSLKRGDHRFIGINSYTCMAPGISDADYRLMRRFGLRCLDGTSDAIESKEHERLQEKASAYARTYNLELYRRITSGLVTE